MQKKTEYIRPLIKAACALTVVVSLGFSLRAFAADEPFDFDSGRWSSYDSYDDHLARHPAPAEPEKPVVIATPVLAAPAAPEKPPVAEKPDPAPPSPVALLLTPTMPGMNKVFNIKITSTEDETEKTMPSVKAHEQPSFLLPTKNWESPALKKNNEQEDDEDKPLNVRMTFLPTQNLVPIPSPEVESGWKLGHQIFKKKPVVAAQNTPAKTPEEAAACAALDTYKKQQLDAIQSDRQTLMALQDAIHSLGLTKQLGFMAGEENAQPKPTGAQSFLPTPQGTP